MMRIRTCIKNYLKTKFFSNTVIKSETFFSEKGTYHRHIHLQTANFDIIFATNAKTTTFKLSINMNPNKSIYISSFSYQEHI